MTETDTPQESEPKPEKADDRVSKSDLLKIMSGEMQPPTRNRRLLAGIISGAIVGFVEGGMPHGNEGLYRSAVYIVIRILTGMACAWVPWRVHAIFRGIVFGLVGGIPFYLTYSRNEVFRGVFLALFAGLLIGYWTERYGISSRNERAPDETV